ncbi:MAG TPA: phosphoribosylglycinamide formyltransferase [Thermoanaerobaculia bacterium]|nr:phosphoribosylglycinamide formyltransferase [Thermoanaerobaculia bacterium]
MRLAVLLSGRGSNFTAIHEAIVRGDLPASIVAVISNRPAAHGIDKARQWGYAVHVLDHRQFSSRDTHEDAIRALLDAVRPDFLALAGYMRLLSPRFVGSWLNRIVNIHPSLLPAFPGVDAQAQALAHGVKVSGCTVHFVDEGLDAGPIIVQRSVPVLDGDSVESLSTRILEQEHVAYVEALQLLASGSYTIDGRRVIRA